MGATIMIVPVAVAGIMPVAGIMKESKVMSLVAVMHVKTGVTL